MKDGTDLLETFDDHPRPKTCRKCGEDVSRTALTELAYAFDVCHCEAAGFPHLVETIYHRRCLSPNAKVRGEE